MPVMTYNLSLQATFQLHTILTLTLQPAGLSVNQFFPHMLCNCGTNSKIPLNNATNGEIKKNKNKFLL